MSSFNEVSTFFPSATNTTQIFVVQLYILIQGISMKAVEIEFYLAILGIILTVFHLTILTRKPMRTSSIISMMIVATVCDLISMILAIVSKDIILNFNQKDCVPPNTLLTFYIYRVISAIRDDVIRCSTWLSVSMALIRYLMIRRAAFNSKIAKFRFGFHILGVTFLVSTVFSILDFFRTKIMKTGDWKPAEYCTDISATEPIYDSVSSDLFEFSNDIIYRVFMFLNGTLSNILPCILLPILTALLISVLRTTERNSQSSNVSTCEKNKIERTTGLVIFISITFFIALLPIGIVTALQAIETDIGFTYIRAYIRMIGSALFTLDASLHCFICFAMSSQYRTTFKGLLRISDNSVVVGIATANSRMGTLVRL